MMEMQRWKNVFTVGICDDEEYAHELLNELLVSYSEEFHTKLEVVHFYSAKEVLESKKVINVLLLDIEMPNMDGIELGRELLKRNIKYKIVMLTANECRYREAFEIEAFRFVTKPVVKSELFNALNDVKNQLKSHKCARVYRDGIAYNVFENNILYVEANKSSTLIYTKKNEYRSDKSIAAWREELDEHLFFQCHRSYIVNLNEIDKIEKKVIHLFSKDKVMVSRRLYTSLLRAYALFDTKKR